jgi:hypothetical protein
MKKRALYFLIIANLVPLTGILFLSWDLFSVLFFYWLESAVVGIYNIARMMFIKSLHKTSGIIFFIVHYSAFMAGHGFFIFALFSPASIKMSTVILGLVSLTISHGVSFVTNFIGHKEYEKVTISQQMLAPYRRIFVMHITIMLCALLLSLFSLPLVTMLILVFLKIAIDIIAHIREHTRLGSWASRASEDSVLGAGNGPASS